MFPSLVYIFSYKKDIPKSNWLSSKISYHVKEQVVEDNRTYMVEKFVLGEEWMILGNLLEHYAAAKSLQLCRTLCDPMDCSLPGFSVHGILQARVLEWVLPFPTRDLPHPEIEPRSPALKADALTSEPPGKPPNYFKPF